MVDLPFLVVCRVDFFHRFTLPGCFEPPVMKYKLAKLAQRSAEFNFFAVILKLFGVPGDGIDAHEIPEMMRKTRKFLSFWGVFSSVSGAKILYLLLCDLTRHDSKLNSSCHCEALFAEAISCGVHLSAVRLEAIIGRLPRRRIRGSQ